MVTRKELSKRENKAKAAAEKAKPAPAEKKRTVKSVSVNQQTGEKTIEYEDSEVKQPTVPTVTKPSTTNVWTPEQALPQSVMPSSPTVAQTQPNYYGASAINAATPLQSLAMTPIGQAAGEFTTGLIQGSSFSNPEGTELESKPSAQILGTLIGFASTLQLSQSLANSVRESLKSPSVKALESLGFDTSKSVSGKYAASKYVTGSPGLVNAFTKAMQGSILIKAGFTIAAVYALMKTAREGYSDLTFGEFQLNEAIQNTNYAKTEARAEAEKTGNYTLVNEINILENEILNPQGWDYIRKNTLFLSGKYGTETNFNAAKKTSEVIKAIDENKKIAFANNETTDQYWIRVNSQKTENDIAITDYYNSERKKLLAWEEEAKDQDMIDDANFWADEAAKQSKLEEEDRKKQAEFWLEYKKREYELEAQARKEQADFWDKYKKQQQKLAENNQKSKLNFGLI